MLPLAELNETERCLRATALSSQNIADYLTSVGLWTKGQRINSIEPLPGKNFNLRVQGGDLDLLVKQAPCELDGRFCEDLLQASWFYQMLHEVGLSDLTARVVQPLYFDRSWATLVFPFLRDVQNLSEFYDRARSDAGQEAVLPVSVASDVGETFAALHRSTFRCETVKSFWMMQFYGSELEEQLVPDFLVGLRRLTPETFCLISTDALKFFRFYQRYPEIEAAMLELSAAFVPCCAVHDDPRFANLLMRSGGELLLIDWEKWRWGDPAYDLGQILAGYLVMWLESLPISAQLDLGMALSLAAVPLSAIAPSTQALLQRYLVCFPQILRARPDFVVRVTQFVGLALMRQVQRDISQKQPIGNIELAMAQVAKSLLCQPASSISSVFGCEVDVFESCIQQEVVCS